jgi:hypothetical protein
MTAKEVREAMRVECKWHRMGMLHPLCGLACTLCTTLAACPLLQRKTT